VRVSRISGRYWFPLGTHTVHGCPDLGSVVAFEHAVWRVVEIRDLPADQYRDADRLYGGKHRPQVVRLRPMRLVDHPDPVKARSEDVHYGSLHVWSWSVYPDPEHYPVCACCGEPMPCRAEEARKTAQDAISTMGRYETAGVCPACEEPVTARQKSLTFPDNLNVLGGPPITFHLRGRCRGTAMGYEKRWVAADPERRRHTLSCPGRLTNHNDGTYDCTDLGDCPGPAAVHFSYCMCRCPDCHARPWVWGRGCHPDPRARRNGDDRPAALSRTPQGEEKDR
jgi:hypothetical protein